MDNFDRRYYTKLFGLDYVYISDKYIDNIKK